MTPLLCGIRADFSIRLLQSVEGVKNEFPLRARQCYAHPRSSDMKFIHEEFLLHSRAAQRLYRQYADL
jgi:hypothetical protein